MTTIMKRLFVLTLAGLVLVGMISGERARGQDSSQATPAATQAANTNLPSAKPVISGTLNNTQVTGMAGSYCWPQVDTSIPQCDVVDDPQPTTPVLVSGGDGILFTTNPASPGPDAFKGTLLDDKNADGEQPQVDLKATGGIFTVENLSTGPHRLAITAIYPGDVEGNQPFVTYVFLLTTHGEPASATPPATEAEPTVGPASPTAPAEQPTVEPTLTAQTPPTTEPVQPTATVAEVQPTETAQTPPTTEVPAVEPTLTPTATLEPVIEPTSTASSGSVVEPTVVEPTANTPPTVVTVNTGNSVSIPTINVPPVTLIVNGRSFEPIAVNTCVQGSQGETICVNRPTNTVVQRVFAAPGDVAQIKFDGPRPTSMTVTQLSSDGTRTIGKQTVQADNLVLYTLPAANGNFILDINIIYPNGKADYFFRLAIES
jgi:hypothetical protein